MRNPLDLKIFRDRPMKVTREHVERKAMAYAPPRISLREKLKRRR